MSKTNLSDGCANAVCPTHGFLARVIVNIAEVWCDKCGRWYRAESPEIRQRRDAERDRKREQRAKARLAA